MHQRYLRATVLSAQAARSSNRLEASQVIRRVFSSTSADASPSTAQSSTTSSTTSATNSGVKSPSKAERRQETVKEKKTVEGSRSRRYSKPRALQQPQKQLDAASRKTGQPTLAAGLIKDKHIEKEWLPTPVKGLDPKPLKSALMRYQARIAADESQGVPGALSQESEMEDDNVAMSFSPGTFVETRKNEISVQGVVLAEIVEERRWRVLSLNSNGEVYVHSRADVHFAIPNFIPADLASKCGPRFVTNDTQEINARVDVLKRLKLATIDVEASYKGSKNWERQRTVNIFNEVRNPDPTRWSKTTVSHVAKLLYTQPTYINYFAAHKYLIENPLHFIATTNYLKSQTLHVRPLRDVEEILTVQRWIGEHRRDEEGPLRVFLKKARAVLQEYQKRMDKNDAGPMTQEAAKFSWSEDDQVFLSFLLRSTNPHRSNQLDPYAMGRNSLMKLLSPTGPPVTDDRTHAMLIKLGVVAPWQDLIALTPAVNPSGDFYTRSPLEKEDEPIVQRTIASKAIAGTVLGPEDLRPTDPLEAVRHDFGKATVFVIDSSTAEELDDGISLERIPSEPDNFWVHVHIADPASHLHPGHILSLKARERGTTFYLAHQSYPLIPKALLNHPDIGMSLGSRSSRGQPDRTLTFSAKLDSKGDILDYQVRAGLVHNVRKITYQDVDDAMGSSGPERKYPFGGEPKRQESSVTLSETEVNELKFLHNVAGVLNKKAFDLGMVNFQSPFASVLWNNLPQDIQSPSMAGSIYKGFPDMTYEITSPLIEDVGSRHMVSEMMKLASRVASRVGVDYNLPLLHRTLEPTIFMSEEHRQDLLDQRTPKGYIDMHRNLGHILINPPAGYSIQPKGHDSLKIPDGEGYSRVTSPLRRFEDLVAHWQLHHILLGPNAPRKPPFDAREMEQICIEIATLDKVNRRLQYLDQHVFALMFLKRWMEDTNRGTERPFGDPTTTIQALKIGHTVRNASEMQYINTVYLPDLGLRAHLVDLDGSFKDVPISAEIPVKVKNIHLGINRPAIHVVLK